MISGGGEGFGTRRAAQKHKKNIQVCVFNPHQRCGYSDSPSTRVQYFYTAGSRNGWTGVDTRAQHLEKEVDPEKNTFLAHQTGSKDWSGSAGIDREAIWPCKIETRRFLLETSQSGQ